MWKDSFHKGLMKTDQLDLRIQALPGELQMTILSYATVGPLEQAPARECINRIISNYHEIIYETLSLYYGTGELYKLILRWILLDSNIGAFQALRDVSINVHYFECVESLQKRQNLSIFRALSFFQLQRCYSFIVNHT